MSVLCDLSQNCIFCLFLSMVLYLYPVDHFVVFWLHFGCSFLIPVSNAIINNNVLVSVISVGT